MRETRRKSRCGFTVVEVAIAAAVCVVIALAVGALLVAGNRAWQNTYHSANNPIKQDSLAASIAFGSMGRKANRLNYTVYMLTGAYLEPALPQTSNPEEVVWGDAVEFRYWDVPLDKDDSHAVVDVTKTATAYALFYLEDDQLKVDYGPYPPGAAPKDGGMRNTADVRTQVLARNVSPGTGRGAFSHTTVNGVGQGSVRIHAVLTDPHDGATTKVMAGTMLRNIWPR